MRWAPVSAVLIFLVAAVVWMGRDRAIATHAYPPGSSLGTGPMGLSLLRGVLEERGVRAATLARPLRHAGLPRDAVLFRVDPGPERRQALRNSPEAPSRRDTGLTEDEEDFVRAGGRLVLGIDGDALEDARPPVKVVPLLAEVRTLAPETPSAVPDDLLLDAQPVFEHDEFPALAVRRLGGGEAWVLAEPAILHNEQLEKADHLALGVALAGEGRPVFFDESVHGDRDEGGMLGLLRGWGLGPAILLAAISLLAAFWRAAATLGPPADDYRETRSEAVDLVDSMAALYDAALSPADALGMFRSRLVHEIALRKALSDRSAEALLPRYAPGLDLSPDFRTQLTVLNTGFKRLRDEQRGGRT
jgi:hypothetical protein